MVKTVRNTFKCNGVEYDEGIYGRMKPFLNAGNDPHGTYIVLANGWDLPVGRLVRPLLGHESLRAPENGYTHFEGMDLDTICREIQLAHPQQLRLSP